MSNLNMSLDEIISKTRANRKGRGTDSSFKSDTVKSSRRPLGRSGGAASNGGGAFSKSVPAGKWRHDKFAEAAQNRGGAVLNAVAVNKKVRVNLSNLASTVLTADLEELFAEYNLDTATVHYGEDGMTLGTGDLTLKKKDALRLIQDFKGVSVDGQRLVMVIVDGEGAAAGRGIFDRVSQSSPPIRRVGGGGIQKRNSSGGPRRSRDSFRNPLDRMEDAPAGGRGGRAAGGGGRGGKGGNKKAQRSEAELDAELDAYMKKKNDAME